MDHRRLREGEGGTEKFCPRCPSSGGWWPATTEYFWTAKTGVAGLFYCCKSCYHAMDRRKGRRAAPAVLPAAEHIAILSNFMRDTHETEPSHDH